jgi:undecaprenyl-diphosphatase
MDYLLKILLLAFIQGITEFFPVSSSGHLVIFQYLLEFKTVPFLFNIVLHLGTLFAVIVYFFKDLRDLTLNFYKKENFRFISYILTASIPTALIGLIFKEPLEKMYTEIQFTGVALIICAIVIFFSKVIRVKKPNIYLASLIIGLFQGIAIIPGMSRSGLTISVALILSMGYEFSFKFSFLLSIPAILGALVLEFSGIPFNSEFIPYLFIGMALSAFFGIMALSLLKRIILKERFHLFAYYCLFAGIVIVIFI